MEELYKLLAERPKEWLNYMVFRLMQEDKISFSELAEMQVKHLEQLKKGETEMLMKLRSKVIDLWCGTKKDLPKKLVALMQEGKDEGWASISQEYIDKSKWNK